MCHQLPFYKCAADLLKTTKEKGLNVKQILFNDNKYKHWNIKSLYALISKALKNWNALEIIINESKILVDEPKLNEWHVRIFITELIFGTEEIDPSNSFGQKILQYEEKFREVLNSKQVQEIINNQPISVPKVRYVKVNTLKKDVISVIDHFTEEGWQFTETADCYQRYLDQLTKLEHDSEWFLRDFHIPEVLVFPPGTLLHQHHLYQNGSICLMDKSSCLAPYLLRPDDHSSVLDMCAAPGLKTIHLAALTEFGKVYAVERDASRFQLLKQMVSICGANNVMTVHSDVTKLPLEKYTDVEYILVDPSCSGSGMRERQPRLDLKRISEKDRLYKLQGFQLTLLRFALTRFPAAKRVVYSTCSLNVEENEEVVQAALNSKYHEFKLANATKKLRGWTSVGSESFEFGRKCVYCHPETDFTNGFFLAVFKRKKHYSSDNLESVVINKQFDAENKGNSEVEYNVENGEVINSPSAMRSKRNHDVCENVKNGNNLSKKRMHSKSEIIQKYSDKKRFKLDIVSKDIKSPQHKTFVNDSFYEYKSDSIITEYNNGINNEKNQFTKNNNLDIPHTNNKNIYENRTLSKNENLKNHKIFKLDILGKNLLPSNNKKRFNNDGNGEVEPTVQQSSNASKSLTMSQKKHRRKQRLCKIQNKVKIKTVKKLRLKKKLIEKSKGKIDECAKTNINLDLNPNEDNLQKKNINGYSQNSVKINPFSKAKLRYNRTKMLKTIMNAKNKSIDCKLVKTDFDGSKKEKGNNKRKLTGNDELNELDSGDKDVSLKKHKKIRRDKNEVVKLIKDTDILNIKYVKKKKSGKLLHELDNEPNQQNNVVHECSTLTISPENNNIPNEEVRYKKRKHKKEHPEEVTTLPKDISIPNEEVGYGKRNNEKEKNNKYVSFNESSITLNESEAVQSRKKKHKKEHPEEVRYRKKNHKKEKNNKYTSINESSITSNESEAVQSRKKKHKKEHPEEVTTLPKDISIPNEEVIFGKLNHKKEKNNKYTSINESSITSNESEAVQSRKKKHKKS